MDIYEGEEPEARALDALIAAAFRLDELELSDPTMLAAFERYLSEQDRRLLDQIDDGAVRAILGSGRLDAREPADAPLAGERSVHEVMPELTGALNRSQDDVPLTEAAKAEMEKRIREAEEGELKP